MNSLKHFKEAFSHLFKGNVVRFFIFLYWAMLVLFKDGIAIVFEWLSSTAKAPGKRKVFGLLPIALLYASYLFLSSGFFSGRSPFLPIFQIIAFVLCFWLSIRLPLVLMNGGKIADFILSIFDSSNVDESSDSKDLRQWQRVNGRKLEQLKKDIYEIFKISKLYIKRDDKPIDYMYVRDTSVNPETDEIVFSISIPLGIAFTEIDKENVRQNILQAFQRYFNKTDSVKLSNSGNTLKIGSHTEKEEIRLSHDQTISLISKNEPFQVTF
jgi:hypothetical protein